MEEYKESSTKEKITDRTTGNRLAGVSANNNKLKKKKKELGLVEKRK